MGIAKTNVSLTINSTSGGGGVAETLPTVIASCIAASGNAKADISWEYTNTDYVAGMRICYKTGGYPENAEDGAYVDIEGAETLSATITGLTNNVMYYFRLFPYNENGDYQASVTNALCECIPTASAITVVAGTATVETGVTEDSTTGYAIISSSGTFDIVASGEQEIMAYLVGGGEKGDKGNRTATGSATTSGGGDGGDGGYVTTLSLMTVNGTATDTAIIGSADSTSGTELVHNGTTYTYTSGEKFQRTGGKSGTETGSPSGTSRTEATSGVDGVSIQGFGYVGSSGGGGGVGAVASAVGGVGAGGGGVFSSTSSSNVIGEAATNYGCGGGGNGGAGMQGCIILNWAL